MVIVNLCKQSACPMKRKQEDLILDTKQNNSSKAVETSKAIVSDVQD